jgi:hypothetical protein
MSDYAEHPELPPAEHERNDVPPRLFAIGLALVVVALLLTGLLVAWLYPASLADRIVSGRVPAYPRPALQTGPRTDMATFFRTEMQRLNGVWWVDQAAGRAHMPIADAMRRVAADGIADWPTGPVDPAPRDDALRYGTPRAATTESGLQRNVQIEDDLPGRNRP